ncbi:unnamed protein product [Cunninghamella echinulata]
MVKQVFYHWMTGAKVVVLDVPLLFESKLDRFVGITVVVFCSEILQLQRLMKRDGLDEEAATKRLRAQTPLSEKVELADIVLDNSSDLSQLTVQVKNLVKKVTPGTLTWLFEYIGPPVIIAGIVVVLKHYSSFIFNIGKSIKA